MDDIAKYYEILGLKIGATLPQVREAYKDLVKVWHPDRFANDPALQTKAHIKIKEINGAFNKVQEFLAHLEAYQRATGGTRPPASDPQPAADGPQEGTGAPQADDAPGSRPEPPREPPPPRAPGDSYRGDGSARPATNMKSLYEAAIGEKNRIYYLAKFMEFDRQGPGLKASWNWPAMLTLVWPLYRKMYGWFFALWGLVTLSTMIQKAGSPGVSLVILIPPCIAFAIFGNSLYHNKIKKKIAAAQLAQQDEPKLLEYLRDKGGVNPWVAWVFGALPIVGILAAIAIPNYLSYREKAKSQQTNSDADTQYNRGETYYNGTGVPKNYAEAARWYLMAADQGHAGAQDCLGQLYRDGKGVAKNYAGQRQLFLPTDDNYKYPLLGVLHNKAPVEEES